MIQITSEFADGGIRANSAASPTAKALWNGYFDFALLATSWDRRCTAVLSCDDLAFGSTVLLSPVGRDSMGLRNSHDPLLARFCERNSAKFMSVETRTPELKAALRIVRQRFWDEVGRRDRRGPAKIFIDVSACSRYISHALLSEAIKSGLVSEVILAYSEGTYPAAEPSYGDLEELSFNDGAFEAAPIPGFFGEFEPRKSKFFLVSVGFDGWKTLNLVIRKEPERVAIVLAGPGVMPDYRERTLAANAALIERFGINEDRIVEASAGDAVEAWKKISAASLERFDAENVYYLCSGNKPHSVALALRALATECPTLLYNRPARHTPVNIEFAGKFWRYCVSPLAGTVLG